MANLTQQELKGTYTEAYDQTKTLITQEEGKNLDRFLSPNKAYYETAAAATEVTDEELKWKMKAKSEMRIKNKNIDETTVTVKNDGDALVKSDGTDGQTPAPDYEVKIATDGTAKIVLLKDITVAAGKKLTVDYSYTSNNNADQTIKGATEKAIEAWSSADELYNAYLNLSKGADGIRWNDDDVDVTALDAKDKNALVAIFDIIFQQDSVIQKLIGDSCTPDMFNIEAAPVDPNATRTAPTYTLSAEQEVNKTLDEATKKDTKNAAFFKMMLAAEADPAAYDNTIAVDMLTLYDIEKQSLNKITDKNELIKTTIVGNANYIAEKDARKANVEAKLKLENVSEYSYGIGTINDSEGSNADPLKNFETMYKKAMGLAEDAEVDFDILFEADATDETKLKAIVMIKEYIGKDLDAMYHEDEYKDALDTRETTMTEQIDALKVEKFYDTKLKAGDKLAEFRGNNIDKAVWTTINGQDISMMMTDLIMKAPAYDVATPENSEQIKKFFEGTLKITTVAELQQLIFDNLVDASGAPDTDLQDIFKTHNQKNDVRNGTIWFVTIKHLAHVIAGTESPYENMDENNLEEAMSEMKEVIAELNQKIDTLTQIPPEELLNEDGTAFEDETKRIAFKKSMDIYKLKDIDRNVREVIGIKYGDKKENASSSDYFAIFNNHRGNISLEYMYWWEEQTANDTFYGLLATNIGSVKIWASMFPSDPTPDSWFSALMRSRTVTDISISLNYLKDKAKEIAYKTNGTLYLDDLNDITKEQAQCFGPQSTALLSMKWLKEIVDPEVAKHFAKTEKKLILDPAIILPAGYRYDVAAQMIIEEAGDKTVDTTPTDETKKYADDILKKVPDTDKDLVDYNKNNPESKFNEIIAIIVIIKDPKCDKLKEILETGDLRKIELIIGITDPYADGKFDQRTLDAIRIYIGIGDTPVQTPGGTVDITPTPDSRKWGDQILIKITDADILKYNKNPENKFYEVIAIVFASKDPKCVELRALLEAGDLKGFQTKIGTGADGLFGGKTLEAIKIYLGIITAPAKGNIDVDTPKKTPETVSDGVVSLHPIDGGYYTGKLVMGKRTGKGEFYSDADGKNLVYKGDRVDGKMEGTGTYYRPDGTKYKGGWKAGLMDGEGTYTNINKVDISWTFEKNVLKKIKNAVLEKWLDKTGMDKLADNAAVEALSTAA